MTDHSSTRAFTRAFAKRMVLFGALWVLAGAAAAVASAGALRIAACCALALGLVDLARGARLLGRAGEDAAARA